MIRWLSRIENRIIKIVIVVLLGFGVGFLINHVWSKAIEAISIGILLLLVYLMGKRLDKYMNDDD